MNSGTIEEAANRFWAIVGFEEAFPRSLEAPIALALRVAIVRLPTLTPRNVSSWLTSAGIQVPIDAHQRPLKGCLIAHKGHGMIFVDGALPADEMRLTLAHELSHYLLHHMWPREAAVERLGESILDVLDGKRSATTVEKLSGVLRNVPLGANSHLLDRDQNGNFVDDKVRSSEVEADLLAFELLAPRREVTRIKGGPGAQERMLISSYGFPPWAAKAWVGMIAIHKKESGFMRALQSAVENLK